MQEWAGLNNSRQGLEEQESSKKWGEAENTQWGRSDLE